MPLYPYACPACGEEHTIQMAMKDYDVKMLVACPACEKPMQRQYTGINVMNAALPDGTRRFDGIRRAREQERQERAKIKERHRKRVDIAREKGLL